MESPKRKCMPPLTGRVVLLLEPPHIWIDNSLSPLVARALKNVGYNIIVQDDIPEFKALQNVLDDEHIIPWQSARTGIWVHKDNDSRTRHAKQIISAGVRTIWVGAPSDFELGSKAQLRLLAF